MRKIKRSVVVLLLAWGMATVPICFANVPSSDSLYIGSPAWFARFDSGGYCDWYNWGESDIHEVGTYHEMLSGEWGAAIYYDGIESAPKATWLTDQFV